MKTLKNLKKNNKGFTLIEIIIVIVIIAILAAMLIPSMISWIDKANQKTFLSACDSIETAILSVATENYATDGIYGIVTDKSDTENTTANWDDVTKLVGSTVAGGKAKAKKGEFNVDLKIDATTKKITGTTIYGDKYKGVVAADGTWTVTDVETKPAG